jgi:hypothetical protein
MYRSRIVFALAMAALAAILLPSSLTAQITFQHTYGGSGAECGNSVQQTSDGGYIIAGFTYSSGESSYDVWLIRTNPRGDTLWTRTFGGEYCDYGYSIQQTTDGGYIVAGSTNSFGAGFYDVYLIKTDAHGDTLWTRTFGGTDRDEGYSVRQTADGGYIIAGFTYSFGAGDGDVYLVKTDTAGDALWTRTFGGAYCDYGWSVRQTSDSGYVIAGATTPSDTEQPNVCLIRTYANGDTQWTRTFGGTGYDVSNSVQQTPDSGYIIAGYTESFGTRYSDVWLIKTTARGDTVWTRNFGGVGPEEGWSVQQTADGGYIVAGGTQSFGAGGFDVYLVRTDAGGDSVWTKTFGGTDLDEGCSVQQTADGGYIIAGFTYSFGAGEDDVYLIKTDSFGNVAVAEPKASPTRAPALSLSCEPNPFRTRTAISLQLTADSPAGLAIFDASGRCVRTLTVNRTPYTVWDGTDELGYALPSGAYFIRCEFAGERATARIVLQR